MRELPAIKYAKKLGNQILSGLKYSEEGFVLDGKEYRLEHPRDDLDDDADNRYYVSVVRISCICWNEYYFYLTCHSFKCSVCEEWRL